MSFLSCGNLLYGPSNVNRFNLFTAINVNASAATGYSSGDAIRAIEEVAEQVLPQGYGIDYSGLTRSERESSDSTAIIFVMCIVFVYLILSAQYESYILPLAVILSIPLGPALCMLLLQAAATGMAYILAVCILWGAMATAFNIAFQDNTIRFAPVTLVIFCLSFSKRSSDRGTAVTAVTSQMPSSR